MASRVLSLAACALLAAATTASSTLLPLGGANGSPDMSGLWIGSKKYFDTDLSEGGESLKGKCALTLSLTQISATLSGTLTLECPGFKTENFTITNGRVGNDRFWFESSQPIAAGGAGNYLLAEGEVKGNKSFKGTGIILYGPDYVTRMSLSGKRAQKR
ncbi:MAG: hypothetical protein IPN34_12765 [Planctomycetes bacterium]|nr:hypothetical protein [Planctomycetota bacterium]